MSEHPDDLQHLASCPSCRERFVAANVVAFNPNRRRDSSRMRDFLETARRSGSDRDVAGDTVTQLLRSTPAAEWSSLAGAPQLRSAVAVDQLIEEVRKRMERTPADALTLANVAASIAEALPAGGTSPAVVLAQLRATAWKERANTLRYLSRFDDALASIHTAEQRLSPFPALAYDRAVVGLVKAMILHHLDRQSDAYQALQECGHIFRDHADSRMLLCAGLIEANFLYMDGHYDRARSTYEWLLDVARTACDRESQARIEHNLGFCETQLREFRNANVHFSNGIALFNDMGAQIEAARAERGAGLLLIAKGQRCEGTRYLRGARNAFRDASMIADSALCGLEIIESLVEDGLADEARALAREISGEIAKAGLSERVVLALQRLDEMIATGVDAQTALEVRNVHAYLQSLTGDAAMPAG